MSPSRPLPGNVWPQVRRLIANELIRRLGTSARLERFRSLIPHLSNTRREWWIARVNHGATPDAFRVGATGDAKWAWRAWRSLNDAALDLGIDVAGLLPAPEPAPDVGPRTRRLSVLLTVEQYARLESLADAHGISLAETARRKLTDRPLADGSNASLMHRATRRKDAL